MSRRPHPLVLLLVLLAGVPLFVTQPASAGAGADVGAFVRVAAGFDAATVVRDHAPGVDVLREYPRISAAFVVGPAVSIGRLARSEPVVHVQPDRALQWLGDTSSWATRVRVVQEFASGGGGLIGSDVGVAIVDTGVNAAHPDLKNSVARNYMYVCTTPGLVSTVTDTCFGNAVIDNVNGDPTPTFGFADVGDTNSDTNGHGTMVAGIIAGQGTMSTGSYPPGTGPNIKGTFTGVAPGATIYSYGTAAGASTLWAVESLYHILVHGNSFSPRISVVNNSWGTPGGAPFVASDIVNVLVDALVANDVTVVFPAGNDGGVGSGDMTSGYCKNPNGGVVCVANYDDGDTGTRDGALDSSSSRASASDATAATWPDVSAPGTLITSTCMRAVQPACNLGYVDDLRWPPWYSTITGTSAAAAHVSGVVALLLQVSPSLSPAGVEDVVQDTAYKFTFGGAYTSDPQNPGGTVSYDKGAGLVDAQAALHAVGLPPITFTAPSSLVLAGADGGDFPFGAADIVSLKVTQTATGFTYALTLKDATDFGPGNAASAAYRLYQTIGGTEYATDVQATASGVTPGAATPLTAMATSASRAGNVVTFTVPFANLGNPPVGVPVRSVRVGAFYGVSVRPIVDMAPGDDAGAIALNVRPMYGRPYVRG